MRSLLLAQDWSRCARCVVRVMDSAYGQCVQCGVQFQQLVANHCARALQWQAGTEEPRALCEHNTAVSRGRKHINILSIYLSVMLYNKR